MGFRGGDTPNRRPSSATYLAAASLFVLVSALVTGCTFSGSPSGAASSPTASGSTASGSDPTVDGQFDIPDFYTPPSPLPAGKHGDIISSMEINAPAGARAWKILYLSELHDGTMVAASGIVVAPNGPAPDGGRKVVAWAHGTEGGGRNCAPSLPTNPAIDLNDYFTYDSPFQQDVGVPALTDMLNAGYVVVATDYQGLGTPGVQQYTVLDSEANNVWDSVKAAQQLKDTGAGDDMVVLGWSQGGGASVWMGQNTSYGAPLKLLGTAALAPAADNGPQFAGQVAPGPENSVSVAHAAALQLNVYRGLLAAYPELTASEVVTPAGEEALAGAGIECVNHLAYVLSSNLTTPFSTLIQPTTPADWQQRLNENTPGYVAPTAPVLVMQGTADTVVNPNGTTQYYQRACGFGQPVEYTIYEGATHQTIPADAKGEYLGWIADRFAGTAAPTTCAPAGSTQTPPAPVPTPSPIPVPGAATPTPTP
ncbi:MAG: secretory lipase [Subtercola sp.]|nr:secretory lipase [Subtercola sp.]